MAVSPRLSLARRASKGEPCLGWQVVIKAKLPLPDAAG